MNPLLFHSKYIKLNKFLCSLGGCVATGSIEIWIIKDCFYKVDFDLAEEDEEVFEDNPEEYIRRDIEGSGKIRVIWITIQLKSLSLTSV